jgi:hypothetical protein
MNSFQRIASVRFDAIHSISSVSASLVRLVSKILSSMCEAFQAYGIFLFEWNFSDQLSRKLKIFEYQMAQMAAENAGISGHPSYFEHASRVALLGAELRKL